MVTPKNSPQNMHKYQQNGIIDTWNIGIFCRERSPIKVVEAWRAVGETE